MTLAGAAETYARRGIHVFPLKPRRKDPVTSHGVLEASCDLAKVRAWWRRRPDCNIGIATGAASGFWVLDVDGEAAEGALEALEAQHGRLPQTVQQQTGRGRHLCFRWDPDGPEMRNRSKVGGADIDVRGNGGYIVAPPSIHPGDAKKGVPPGRVYGWSLNRSPDDLPFADAPEWLVELCRPRDQVAKAAAPAAPATPRPNAGGRASRYGEAVLEGCCRTIATAQKGARDSTLYRFACKAAGLVPTGHIEAGYLRESLLHAGAGHVPDAMSQAQLERQVDRAIAWGAEHGWGPDDSRPGRARSGVRGAPAARSTAVDDALARADGLRELDASMPAMGAAVAAWFELLGVDPGAIPGGLDRLRVVAHGRGLAFALGLQRGPGEPVDGLAVFAMGRAGGCVSIRGLSEGRVSILAWPEGADQVLVTTRLDDAWTLGAAAFESGDPMAVVVAPRLSAFAGAPLGDRWGRVSVETPAADPARPAWTWPGMSAVYLAVRRDLAGPELRARKATGGTRTLRLAGEAAHRFWGGLAAANWMRALAGTPGAHAVRVVSPPGSAAGFSGFESGVA